MSCKSEIVSDTFHPWTDKSKEISFNDSRSVGLGNGEEKT